MATTLIEGRQYPLVALAAATPENNGAGNEIVVNVRPGTLLRGVQVLTLTAFDSTTNTITIADGTTVFVNAQDIKSTGSETAAVAFKYYPSGGTITVSLASTGTAPTAGLVHILLDFVQVGRANELHR